MKSAGFLLPSSALLATLLAGCARMEAPPGGPEDRKRPFVAAVYPAPGAVNVPRELKAKIEFSEWVAQDAARGKVWLSPPPARRLKVEAKGRIIEVTSEAPLDSGTTYVLGISGSIKDLAGLPLESPFQLVFSTGPALDSGILGGRLAVFPGKRPEPGAFAAFYPIDRDLRRRFGYLVNGPAGLPIADSLPSPFRERPAYLAPADSLGRFGLEGARPGRYLLLGFQDNDLDGIPDAGPEPLAIGPAVEVGLQAGAPRSLALGAMDTLANRLVSVRWAHENLVQGRSHGTVRLKFGRPVHPSRALRRDLYSVRKAGKPGVPGVPVPIMDICLNPEGEVELYTVPLEAESSYVAACGAVPDLMGNPLDTARDESGFKATLADSAAATAGAAAGASAAAPGTQAAPAAPGALPAPVFLGQRRLTGQREPLSREAVFPSRPLRAYLPRILTDSLLAEITARIEVKSDTVPVTTFVVRVSHHEIDLRLAPFALKGQALHIGYRPPRVAAAPAPLPGAPAAPVGPAPKPPAPAAPDSTRPVPPAGPRTTLRVADSAELGSLQFRQDPSAHGSVLVLRSLDGSIEAVRVTPAREEFTVDSLPKGPYSAAYFRDMDRDTLWTPGRFRPWTPQEDFVPFADSVEVRPGGVSPGSASGARLAFPPSW